MIKRANRQNPIRKFNKLIDQKETAWHLSPSTVRAHSMAKRLCLQLVKIDPPVFQCSECDAAFYPQGDSLRAVLKEFREHIRTKHPTGDFIPPSVKE